MTRLVATSIATLLATTASWAAQPEAATELDALEVSATRLRGVADLDVPASVTTRSIADDSNRAQVNVTELLGGIPGVTALDRQNYAQDTQLSIRGFGARASFGVRGLRLYSDGIPASMPDGQGQLSHFSLLGAEHIQIMRGPFTSLHGNSAGGVVQMWSRPGTADATGRVRTTYGSHDTRSLGAQALGTMGTVDYNLAASRFQTDGYRPHSAARRDVMNARFGFDAGEDRSVVAVFNYMDTPDAQDTLGLTPADWRANPRQAASVATQFNTRKSVEQLQGGVILEQKIGGNHTLHVMGYTGNRKVEQYLAIPVATQGNALHSGGVVDLDNNMHGADLRWSWEGALAGRDFEVTFGSNFDSQRQLRRGYNNFVGTTLGVRGVLRRDEINRIENIDEFLQAWWQLADRWSVLAGLRHSEVNFTSTDRYIVTGNPNDSGHKRYGDTTAVGGVMFRATDALRLYASFGDGFETPTFNELSYRADGGAGLAFNLLAARSKNHELGIKWHPGNGIELEAALFRANTDNELVVARNSGGRSSFRNVGKARRQGAEASVALPFGDAWRIESSYTYLDAEFRTSYTVCSGTPCTTPNITVPAGSRIPGVPRHQGQLSLQWNPGVWNAALEFAASSSLIVNDIATVSAPGYGLWHAELGRDWNMSGGALRAFVRIENLLDKNYVGSVIVNEGNSRFFESGLDRNGMIGLQWKWL